MRARWTTAGTIALLLSIGTVTACSPEPTPTPTPTGFASEEEAFAAAEETYRAYVAALNEVDLSDPATFEPVYANLTGEARDSSKRELTGYHADGLRKIGPTRLIAFYGDSLDANEGRLSGEVCLDVTQVQLENSEGRSVVPSDRNNFPLLEVEFTVDGARQVLITSSNLVSDQPCQ